MSIRIGEVSLESDQKKAFEPVSEGMHNAVCVDVEYLGWVTETYEGDTKTVQKIRVVFETDDLMPDGSEGFDGEDISGRPKTIGKKYTLSQHPKSNLSKHLEGWRGRPWSAEELDPNIGWDMEELLTMPAQLLVKHTQITDERTKAPKTIGLIETVLKGKDPKLTPSGHYVRVKDREGYVQPGTSKPK